MILCVTLNPCLDKTLTVPHWQPGDNIRGLAVREVVGGKGNNVARALRRLGRDPRPVTFLGGPLADHCLQLLQRDDQLEPFVIPSAAPTRTILTVHTDPGPHQPGHTPDTAFFDPDPAISTAEAEALLRLVDHQLRSGNVEALTLSGSSPAPATDELYLDLIAAARARRVPVLLDTYGRALAAIWGFWPHVLQLNRREAAGHLGIERPEPADLRRLLDHWARHGVHTAVVTDGHRPIHARIGNQHLRAIPPEIQPINPIGSGDCLLAGLTNALLSGLDPESTLRHATACAVSNALTWDAGSISPAQVASLESQVQITPWPV